MKNISFYFISLLISYQLSAQQQKFDITNYSLSGGWKKQVTDKALQFTKQDAAKGTYCIITLYKSLEATNDSKANFTAAWESLVKETMNINTAPQMQPASKENGWEAQTGSAEFESEGSKGVALLVASTGYNKLVNILVLANTDTWQNELGSFFESISFTKPAEGNTNTVKPVTQPVQPAAKSNFTYSTTNFTEGWVSTVYNDYVLSVKGNIKVYLSFIEKFNASDFTGTGKEARFYYWDNWVGKYFTTGDKKFQTASALSDYSENYIEGWAIDKQTGERRYIGMILNIIAYTGTLSIIVASAPDAAQLRQQFQKADLKFSNDLLPMYSYNKFAVGKNDLAGTWSSNGGGTVSWYSTTTGQYAGATGAAMSDRFVFNANGTYSSEHKGGYGVVGAMNVYQQKYNGAYTVSDWQVTASKRWDGKTEIFDAWFEIVRGGRVLHLSAGGGKSYTLYKEN